MFEKEQLEARAVLEMAKGFLPILEEAVEIFGPILSETFGKVNRYLREKTVENFEYYRSKGFDRQEALLLVIDSNASLKQVLDSSMNNKKKR